MPFLPSCAAQASLRRSEIWRQRRLSVQAMALLCLARLFVAFVPLRMWRHTIGHVCSARSIQPNPAATKPAQRVAAHVEQAASRLPFDTKCLPRAMTLAWLLQMQGVPYTIKLAARPVQMRNGKDDLHAWVEVGGTAILGWVDGPWIVVLTLTR